MSLPPAARPPGRKLVGAAKAEVAFARRVQGTLCAGALAKLSEKPKKPSSVSHVRVFRDKYGVQRNPNGQFAKESGVPHKRPVKKPPFVGPWSPERKAKARVTRTTKRREP